MGLSIFWDNSNDWLVGRGISHQRESGDKLAFRIHFAHLLDFVLNGRQLHYAFVGASILPSSDLLWRRFENLGTVVDRQERGE